MREFVVRLFAFVLCVAMGAPATALAQRPAGIAGFVMDLDHQTPLGHARVAIYRLPLAGTNIEPVAALETNARGFFADINLAAGSYLVTSSARGLSSTCEIGELYDGVVNRIRIGVSSSGVQCAGKNAHGVVPGQTSDVYILH